MATPMAADTLVRVLTGEGLTVKTPHSGWTTHERDAATGKPFGPVYGVVMHHTAGLNVYEYVYNGSASLPGPLCHAYIDKKGVVSMCSAGRANHAGGGDPAVLNAVINESYGSAPPAPHYGEGDAGAADGNDPFYGFECENLGDGNDPWPEVQYNAMVKAAAAILRYYEWTDKSVIGHLEWSHYKSDPRGFPMPQFREDVKACLAAAPGHWPAPEEGPVTLSTADVQKIWEQDGTIPAARPPYENDDYDTNQTWRANYAMQTVVEHTREATARLEVIEAKIDQIITLLQAQ